MDEIIQAHVQEHVAHPTLTDRERREGAEELIKAIRRYSK
jgi:DNA-binding FrmR family transcriptional regulator